MKSFKLQRIKNTPILSADTSGLIYQKYVASEVRALEILIPEDFPTYWKYSAEHLFLCRARRWF